MSEEADVFSDEEDDLEDFIDNVIDE